MPPASSKNRSAMTVVKVGTAPRIARPAVTYSTSCSAPARSVLQVSMIAATAASAAGRREAASPGCASGVSRLISSRKAATWPESSAVRAGASPRQKGMFGAAPCASSTSTRPLDVTRRMRHDVFPSSITSPAMLSTAKSSSTVPIGVPSGSATTAYKALSGIAPPAVIAVMRLPRRPRTRPLTRSRWRYAPYRPRFAAMPCASISMISSNSGRVRSW